MDLILRFKNSSRHSYNHVWYFIQNVVDFLIVAACIFTMLKFLAHFKKTTNDQLDQKEPKKEDTVVLLEEIRDLLKKIDKVK